MAIIPVTVTGSGSNPFTPSETAFLQHLADLPYVQGDMLYYDGTNLTNLGIGTAGQILTVNAGATAPQWSTSGGGTGTVTTVSVVTANGFAGTVANATTTPAITLTTSLTTPVIAGNGTALIAATTTGSGSTVVLNNSPTFLDDITVGTAATATGQILFKGTTSGTVTLSVADAAGTWTMKLPTTAGTSNQFLQTDGSGNTTWATGGTGTGSNAFSWFIS